MNFHKDSFNFIFILFKIAINPKNLPLLFHCMNGVEITGLLVMCFRKMETISLSFAMTEYMRLRTLSNFYLSNLFLNEIN